MSGPKLTNYNPIKEVTYTTPGIKLKYLNSDDEIYCCYKSISNAPPKLIDGDNFISTAGATINVLDPLNFVVDSNGQTTGGRKLSFTSMDGIIFNSSYSTDMLFTAKLISYHDVKTYKINGQAIEITMSVNNIETNPIIFIFNKNDKYESFTNMNPVENLPVIQINQYKIYPTLKNKSSQEISTYQPNPSDSPFLDYKKIANNLFSL